MRFVIDRLKASELVLSSVYVKDNAVFVKVSEVEVLSARNELKLAVRRAEDLQVSSTRARWHFLTLTSRLLFTVRWTARRTWTTQWATVRTKISFSSRLAGYRASPGERWQYLGNDSFT